MASNELQFSDSKYILFLKLHEYGICLIKTRLSPMCHPVFAAYYEYLFKFQITSQ